MGPLIANELEGPANRVEYLRRGVDIPALRKPGVLRDTKARELGEFFAAQSRRSSLTRRAPGAQTCQQVAP